jgi:hypothetical protein
MAQKQLSATERLVLLEKKMDGFEKSLDINVEQNRSLVIGAMEMIDALVGVLDDSNLVQDIKAALQNKVQANKQARVDAQLKNEAAQRATLVEMGVLKVAETIGPRSLMVVNMSDPDGNPNGLPKRQVETLQIHDHLREKFLGQKAGFVFESEQKEKMEVLEIYDICDTKQEASAPLAVVEALPASEAPSATEAPVAAVES